MATANQSVANLIIMVIATAISFGILFKIRRPVILPSVSPSPPGSIEIAPAIVENE